MKVAERSWALPFLDGIPCAMREQLPLVGAGALRRVSDADGLEVYLGEDVVKVRLAGVDGPEIGSPDALVRIASAVCRAQLEKLTAGQLVELRGDPLQRQDDRYGRLICYAYTVGSGEDLCRKLIEGGFARAWRGGRYVRRREFVRVELEARKRLAGLERRARRAEDVDGKKSSGSVLTSNAEASGQIRRDNAELPGSEQD